MVWAGADYPQEHEVTPPDCGHEGAQYHVLDGLGVESVSCVDCIAFEIETLKQGCPVQWQIERLTDDEEWGDDTARMIRRLWETGDFTQPQLAAAFRASTGAVSAIVRRKSWRHVA